MSTPPPDGGRDGDGLAARHCEPCRGGATALSGDALVSLARELGGGWRVVDGHHLENGYAFRDFRQAMTFALRVGELAEREAHHPHIHISWGLVRLEIWTQKIDGLSVNDFILAARISEAFRTRSAS